MEWNHLSQFNNKMISESCTENFYKYLGRNADGSLRVVMHGKSQTITKQEWGIHFKIPYEGAKYPKSFNKAKTWKKLTGHKFLKECKSVTTIEDQLHRMLFFYTTRNLLCKFEGNLSQWYSKDLWIVHSAIIGLKIDVTEVIFNQMIRAKNTKNSSSLPYANMIIDFCKSHNLCCDIYSNDYKANLEQPITTQTLSQMKFKPVKKAKPESESFLGSEALALLNDTKSGLAECLASIQGLQSELQVMRSHVLSELADMKF